MNKMVRKLKKSNKVLRFLYYLVMVFYVVGLVLFIKSLLSLTGVETMIRTIVIIFFIIYFVKKFYFMRYRRESNNDQYYRTYRAYRPSGKPSGTQRITFNAQWGISLPRAWLCISLFWCDRGDPSSGSGGTESLRDQGL